MTAYPPLSRDPKTGALEGSRWLRLVEAAAQERADETGASPRECYADAALAVAKEQPDLYREHQALQLADHKPEYRGALSPELCAALDAVHRADQFAVEVDDTPAPSGFDQFTEHVLATRYSGDRAQYAAAALDAARERPDLFRNRHVPAESFTQAGLRLVKEGAHIGEVNEAGLKEMAASISVKEARAALAVLATIAPGALEDALRGAGVDVGPLEADRAALSARVSPVTLDRRGSGGQIVTGTNSAAHSALATLQKKMMAGELSDEETELVRRDVEYVDEGIQKLLAKLTPDEAVKLRQWLTAKDEADRAAELAEAERVSTQAVAAMDAKLDGAHSARPRVERFAHGENFGTLQSVLAGGPIKILPMGKFHRDTRVLNITEQDLRNIEANAAKGLPNFRIPVNLEHQGALGKVGTLKTIKYMPKGPDGPGLYARAEWTDAGRQLIGEQKFDSVSVEIVWDKAGATFQDPKTGAHVGSGVITGLALTNSPFFGHEHVALFHKEAR